MFYELINIDSDSNNSACLLFVVGVKNLVRFILNSRDYQFILNIKRIFIFFVYSLCDLLRGKFMLGASEILTWKLV